MSKKYIFITGGASGMGKSTVQLFIDKGWFVGCYDINKKNLNALEEEINSENLMFKISVNFAIVREKKCLEFC